MFEYLNKRKWLMVLVILLLGVFFQFSLDVIFSLMYKNHQLITHLYNYIISCILSFLVLLALTWISKWLNEKYSWERAPGRRFYMQVILITVAMVLVINALRFLIIVIFKPGTFIRLLDEMVVTVFFVFMGLLLVFIDLGVNLQNKWRYSLAEIERYRSENIKTQFEMLRIQVNPHFLFNSLNTLSSLIYQDRDTASGYVRELSSVYRYILDKRQQEIVSLQEELQFTASYIYLQRIRFDRKLTINLTIDPAQLILNIVPLTLQILIENAVKHNIVSEKRPLTVEIFSEGEQMIAVSNNLQKKTGETYSSGIGLDNIRNRLSVLTKNKVVVTETENIFKVSVPLLTSDEIKMKGF